MRAILLFILASFGILFLIPSNTWAECDVNTPDAVGFLKGCAGTPENAVDPSKIGSGPDGVKQLVQDVAKKVIEFGALFAIGAIVFAGIRYTTSYGDDEKIKHAKTTGIYALIGLLLLGLAFPLVDIIVNFIYTFGK